MSDKIFNILRAVSELVVPLAAFVCAMGENWGIPVAPVVGTITAFGVLLGACVSILRGIYNGGNDDE